VEGGRLSAMTSYPLGLTNSHTFGLSCRRFLYRPRRTEGIMPSEIEPSVLLHPNWPACLGAPSEPPFGGSFGLDWFRWQHSAMRNYIFW